MKAAAILLPVLAALAADVNPRSSTFNPRRLGEERSFPAANLMVISPGGKYVAYSTGGGIGIIDAKSGRDLGALGDLGGGLHDQNFGQSDRFLATSAENGVVKIFDAETRKEIASIEKPPHPAYT